VITVLKPPAADLADLLARVAARDREAFAAVYKATSAKLWGIVVRVLPRRALAEDVLQDVYVRIWERAETFDPAKASPITWMATIARNRAIDEVRRRAPISIDDAPEALEVEQGGLSPLDSAQQSEDLRRLQECLQGLDPVRREIVLLAYYNGLSREELAKRFAHPVATIKTWLHRSLAQLRKCLGS
jgi:RNA polymerase sigma-70 factor, ECF subfamily